MKKIHSIILARGNSKGIKNKNMIRVNGKPLIYWSIIRSLKSKKIDYTWVSSDSDKILNYSKKIGANIIKRPKKISNDTASSESGWRHAIKNIEKKYNIDFVVGIQPTSPIRATDDFDKALKIYFLKKLDTLFTCSKLKDFFIWKEQKNRLIPNYSKRKPRQKIKTTFLENGSFYIFSKDMFLVKKNRLFGKIGKYVQSKVKSIQIDDYDDLFVINSYFTKKNYKYIFKKT